jgi:hypothetical protein
MLGIKNLKATRDTLSRWRVVAVALRQASHASLAAVRAPEFFVPFIDHTPNMDSELWKFHGKALSVFDPSCPNLLKDVRPV